MMDGDGLFRRIYAVGRAGSRTPDPYDSQGVQLQVRVDLQLEIDSFVAVCRVLRSAPKRGKKCLWGWPEDENVLRCHIAKRGLLWVSAPQAGEKYGSACPPFSRTQRHLLLHSIPEEHFS